MSVSVENAKHYLWGEINDGWHLLKRDDLSVIQEHVPAGGVEVVHYPEGSRQFFYILEDEGMIVFENHEVVLTKGQGHEIPPQVTYQFKNQSKVEVLFLVTSVPATRGDRINV